MQGSGGYPARFARYHLRMGMWRDRARKAGAFAAEAVAETLWPTRCALCDIPGAVLCSACRSQLPYLDWWRACPRCGSAYGFVQCTACNPLALARIERDELPYAACTSSTVFTDETGRIARVFKDQGERRLAGVMADCMARAIAPDWPIDAIAFVPATVRAVRHRGFDHAELLAKELSQHLGTPCMPLLDRPKTRDQRKLGSAERIANLRESFRMAPGKSADGLRLLLVDDVYTTGATLCAAADALLSASAAEVRCVTFARV